METLCSFTLSRILLTFKVTRNPCSAVHLTHGRRAHLSHILLFEHISQITVLLHAIHTRHNNLLCKFTRKTNFSFNHLIFKDFCKQRKAESVITSSNNIVIHGRDAAMSRSCTPIPPSPPYDNTSVLPVRRVLARTHTFRSRYLNLIFALYFKWLCHG